MAKRKKKPDRAEETSGHDQHQPLRDRRLMDRTMAGIQALLAGQNFESVEEANAFLQEMLQEGVAPPPPPAETPLQNAQAVMYQAFEAHGRERIKLAKKALIISPDCADAYVLLAEEEARSLEKANDYYAQGVHAGRRALGPEMFSENEGRFWGIVETRPFMRAMHGYAQTLWWLGDRQTSVAIQQEMLQLNPNDNQGVRYFLTHCLLEMFQLDDLETLFEQFPEDISAEFKYPRALATFLDLGHSPKADHRLREAIQANPYVPAYLLGEKQLPSEPPEYYGLGDENEAVNYVAAFGVFWPNTEGALEWLRTMADRLAVESDAAVDDEEWEDYDGFPPFRLEEFLAAGEFPKSEHGSIRRCLAVGLGKYFLDIYDYPKYGKQPTYLIDEAMHVPYVFGYGAVEVIRHKRLRTASKVAVCQHALMMMSLGADDGIPYGVLTMLSYLAAQDLLVYPLLQAIAVGLGFSTRMRFYRPDWIEGTAKEELLTLTDWIAANKEIPAAEKLWWAWRLCVESDSRPHLGKAMADRWLSLDALSRDDKLHLCHAWLESREVAGSPPALWQVYAAVSTGSLSEVKDLFQQHDLAVPPEIEEMLERGAQEYTAPEPGSFEELLSSMRGWVRTPHYLQRLAVPALVRFGEDLEATIETYWESDSPFDVVARTGGVADTIREFSDRLQPERLRELVERGIHHALVQTRKTFYILSEDFYGDEYLHLALEDNAASLRKWAAKRQQKSG